MQLSRKQRFVVFSLVVVLAAAVTVRWSLGKAWDALSEVEALDKKFSKDVFQDSQTLAEMQKQYSDIAKYTLSEVEEVNESLSAIALRNDPNELARFRTGSLALRTWLQQEEVAVMQPKVI